LGPGNKNGGFFQIKRPLSCPRGSPSSPGRLKEIRKTIARIKTIRKEKAGEAG